MVNFPQFHQEDLWRVGSIAVAFFKFYSRTLSANKAVRKGTALLMREQMVGSWMDGMVQYRV